jgi:H+/Cl- antiporter ClcA
MGIDKIRNFFHSDNFRITKQRFELAAFTFLKWLAISVLTGVTMGLIGTVFGHLLTLVTTIRQTYQWLLFLLPVSGLLIVFLYNVTGNGNNKGTNLVITAIQSDEEVPGKVAPLIMLSTLLTHLCGGSAGREGAALQIGGCIGNELAKFFAFDEKDTRILIMCGMSGCFAALFGTPIAATIFSMEVISVGIMYYAALVPCTMSAIIACGISTFLGLTPTRFDIGTLPSFYIGNITKIMLLAIIFALASILLCVILHKSAKLYNKYLPNQYARIVVAGILVIALRYITGTTDYLGAGGDVIARSFVTRSVWCAFLLKMIFTAVTLGGGFKGGEIVPTLFVGATLGSFLAPIFGLPIGLCAACGMVSVFCGVTNCPLTSLILSVEMFGSGSLKFCMISIAISYLLSGYYSLYNSQKIMYSKYKTEYVNRNTH